MKNTLQFIVGFIVAWMLVALVFVLLVLCAGCAYDPITPAHRPHAPRPNPYGVTNQPATLDQFRAAPPEPRQLVPERMVQPAAVSRSREAPPQRSISAAGWEFPIVAADNLKQVPFIRTNDTIQWLAKPGYYRLLVSDDNMLWRTLSLTCEFRMTNWASVAIPTNKYFRLVSP